MSVALSPAPVDEAITDGARYVRFRALLTWLEALGVCSCCRVGMAIAQTEREMGDKTWRCTPIACTRHDAHGRTCAELARAHWKDKPTP